MYLLTAHGVDWIIGQLSSRVSVVRGSFLFFARAKWVLTLSLNLQYLGGSIVIWIWACFYLLIVVLTHSICHFWGWKVAFQVLSFFCYVVAREIWFMSFILEFTVFTC